MSDTTNVMKGARSGVQKLIRNENPSVYYARCICHLADLTVKAGMQALPVKIDQYLLTLLYTIYTIVVKQDRNSMIYGAHSSRQSQ